MKPCKGKIILYTSVILNAGMFISFYYILEKKYRVPFPSAIFTIPYITACYFLCKKKKWANVMYHAYSFFKILEGIGAIILEVKIVFPQTTSSMHRIYVFWGVVNCITLALLYCKPVRSYLREPSIDSTKRNRKH